VKKIIKAPRNSSDTQLVLKTRTGFHCPVNGFWRSDDRSLEVFVFEGSVMPPGINGSTEWTLLDRNVQSPLPAAAGEPTFAPGAKEGGASR
jgi:hypothetical protein